MPTIILLLMVRCCRSQLLNPLSTLTVLHDQLYVLRVISRLDFKRYTGCGRMSSPSPVDNQLLVQGLFALILSEQSSLWLPLIAHFRVMGAVRRLNRCILS